MNEDSSSELKSYVEIIPDDATVEIIKVPHGSLTNSNKTITLSDALAIVFGTIVGSGVFMGVQEPYFVFESHNMLFVTLFWVFFGIIVIFGGLIYAELGTRIPESGGDYTYLKNILSPKISFVFIIFYAFVVQTLSISALSITTSIYILKIFHNNPYDQKVELQMVAITIILVCFIINYFSRFLATKTSVVTTFTKTAAMLFIIGCGIYYMGKGNTDGWHDPRGYQGFSLKYLGSAFIAVFYAHDGGNTLGMVAGDMKNPARDLPIAIICGIGGVVIFYVLVIVSYPAILGYEMARSTSGVAYECAVKVLGRFAPIMSILICSSSFGSANSMVFSVSSAMAAAGVSGELPKIFSLLTKKNRTFVFSSFVVCIASIIGTFLDFDTLLTYTSFTALIFYNFTYVALWLIKLKTMNEKNTNIFQVPFYLIIPVQLVSVLIIALSIQIRPIGSLAMIFLLLLTFQINFIDISKENKIYKIILFKQDQFISFCENYLGMDLANINDVS